MAVAILTAPGHARAAGSEIRRASNKGALGGLHLENQISVPQLLCMRKKAVSLCCAASCSCCGCLVGPFSGHIAGCKTPPAKNTTKEGWEAGVDVLHF